MSRNSSRKICDATVVDLGNIDSAEVMAVGDFHIGDENMYPGYLDDIIYWVNEKPNRFLMISGDIFNAAIIGSKSDVYHERMTMDEAIDYFGNFLRRVGADKIIACIFGNHDERVALKVGIDPVKIACDANEVRYCGPEAYCTVMLGNWRQHRNNGDKRSPVRYTWYVHHGRGGGVSPASGLTNVLKYRETIVADIYQQGHTHKPMIYPATTYEYSPDGASILQREQLFVVTGANLERGGYARSKGYSPNCVRNPVVMLSGIEKRMSATI